MSGKHPDFFNGLMDWPFYGPKDSEIADLVLALADRGLRLAEIEAGMKQHLESWLREIEQEKLPSISKPERPVGSD